ncbi:MAG: hypothetical protein Q8P57_05045 [Candidatus Pacearchaeota archaeon]|nr:hypothetical protein [Candidatus Pacearchaeota archaeon]
MDKRGQVTIFIIIAIVIVVGITLLFFFPGVSILSSEVNPSSYLRSCIESEVKDTLSVLSKQGGYLEPDNYLMYLDNKIQYLCYTSENYLPCKVQQPLLVKHMEEEIKGKIEPVARQCVKNLEEQYKSQGYSVRTTQGQVEVDIELGKIAVNFLSPMTIEKESVQTFSKFAVSINSELYDLLSLATNIIQFESTFGDAETSLYISYYPDLNMEKIKRNGDTIYKLRNVITGDEFTFASRSLVWPQGYV